MRTPQPRPPIARARPIRSIEASNENANRAKGSREPAAPGGTHARRYIRKAPALDLGPRSEPAPTSGRRGHDDCSDGDVGTLDPGRP